MQNYYVEGLDFPLFQYEECKECDGYIEYTGVSNFITYKSRENATVCIDGIGYLEYSVDGELVCCANVNELTNYDILVSNGDSNKLYKTKEGYPVFRYKSHGEEITGTTCYMGVLPLVNGVPYMPKMNAYHVGGGIFRFIGPDADLVVTDEAMENCINQLMN